MQALTRQTRCGFKLEGTAGTYETLAAANCVTPVFNSSVTSNVEINEQPEQGTLSRRQIRKGARGGAAEFETELYGSGSTTDPYWMTHLLPTCGFAIASHVATPSTTAAGTLSFGRYLGTDVQKALSGAMGGFTLTSRRATEARIRWRYTGIYQTPTKIVYPVGVTLDTVSPPKGGGVALTIGGQTLTFPELIIEVNNTVELIEDWAAKKDRVDATLATGHAYAKITARDIRFRLSTQAMDPDDLDICAAFVAGTTYAISAQIGTVAGNKFVFAAPKGELIEDPTDGDRNGFVTDELVFRATENTATGDDEFSITFTPTA
jgi:hypothetical protein